MLREQSAQPNPASAVPRVRVVRSLQRIVPQRVSQEAIELQVRPPNVHSIWFLRENAISGTFSQEASMKLPVNIPFLGDGYPCFTS